MPTEYEKLKQKIRVNPKLPEYPDIILSKEEVEEKIKDGDPWFDCRYGGKYYWSYLIKKHILDNPFIPHIPFKLQLQILMDNAWIIGTGGSVGGSKSELLAMQSLFHFNNSPDYNEEGHHTLIMRKQLNSLKRAG
jgi:hypothetical protein